MTTLPSYLKHGMGLKPKEAWEDRDITNKIRHATMKRRKRRAANKRARKARRL